MKTLYQIIIIALAGAATSASAETFIRPTAHYVKPTADGYSGAGAAGIYTGISRGENLEHEFGFELAYVRWNSSGSVPGVAISASEHYMPYLINYRFIFGQKGAKVRPYFGPAVGLMNSRINVNVQTSSGRYSESSSVWAFSAAGSVGVLVKLSERINLDLGYKYLHSDPATYTFSGVNVQADAAQAHLLGGGISFRF